jgi:hypothetical protein
MEEAVKDALLTGECEDHVLGLLIEMTASSISEERPLFENLKSEPIFYRKYFKKWVQEGLQESQAARKSEDEIQHQAVHTEEV